MPHPVVLVGVGAVGWGCLIALTLAAPVGFRRWAFSGEFVAIACLACMSRFLAFCVFRRVRIALDAAFYVAAAFLCGVVAAAWMVVFVLTLDGVLSRARDAGRIAREAGLWWHGAAQAAHDGALPALVMLATGGFFGLDGRHPLSEHDIIRLLPPFAVCFLLLTYVLAGGARWLQGAQPHVLQRGFLLRAVATELILAPVSLAMVLGYAQRRFGVFLLLGTTCLMFGLLFRRMVVTGESLQHRVEELATLNKVGRILSSSLERRALVANIARETLALVGHASHFTLGLLDGATGMMVYELFDARGGAGRRLRVPRDAGPGGWVMVNRQPLLLGHGQRQRDLHGLGDLHPELSACSWLGVPLEIYNEVAGIMSVQSEQCGAYNDGHLRVMGMIADQAAVALENARLYELATIDGLTGLFVRRYFDQRMREEWLRSSRYGSAFSLGIVDVDDFKHCNDTFGHQAGDRVLRAVAAVLRNNMRSFEIAARFGGEEFAFILPRTGVADAGRVGERIRGDIERVVVVDAGVRLQVTVSVGMAGFPDNNVTDVADLVARADQALYQAKRDGKNRVVVDGWPGREGILAHIGQPKDAAWAPEGAVRSHANACKHRSGDDVAGRGGCG